MKPAKENLICFIVLLALVSFSQLAWPAAGRAEGPLRVHPKNRRYFTDGTKLQDGSLRVIFLSGFQFWDVFDDEGHPSPDGIAFEQFLGIAEKYELNFIRLWRWNELTRFHYGDENSANYSLHPWARTGPGNALDGKPKFNLEHFNESYFEQLRSRVSEAGRRGMYVAVMLFEGWSLRNAAKPWVSDSHPFNKHNNLNGIDGDVDGDGRVMETHTLRMPAVNAIQESYVCKVVDTLNDLDNVLYEVANEDGNYSVEWQYHLINFINKYQATKPKRHPAGMTCLGIDDLSPAADTVQQALFDSPADWISPWTKAPAPYHYLDNPPPADGRKVIISDTDHLTGGPADRAWVWKSFTRGLNINNYMELRELRADKPWLEQARRAMGDTRRYAERMNLAAATPHPDIASTGYCLAAPGAEYLIYQPKSGASFTANLQPGRYACEWFSPEDGRTARSANIDAPGGTHEFTPQHSGDAVLYLKKE